MVKFLYYDYFSYLQYSFKTRGDVLLISCCDCHEGHVAAKIENTSGIDTILRSDPFLKPSF